MSTKYFGLMKTQWFIGVAGLILGAAFILGIRLATYKVEAVHYHANFGLYLNGKQEEFKGIQYYTEVEMCTLDTAIQPTQRAHMHDNINNVVHVEDHAVTWGQFFTNLGWTVGTDFVVSPDGTLYKEGDANKLHIMLNDQDITGYGGIQNRVIKDKDRMLVSFGDINDATLAKEYATVPTTAGKYDTTKDPASCSGNHQTTMHDRLTHMF